MLDRSLLVAVLSLIGVPGVQAQLIRRAPPPRAEPAGNIQITLPATMRGGDTVSGSVQLPSNAPVGGMRVTFSSDHADLASAIEAVTVPAFQRSAAFRVAAGARRGAPAVVVSVTATTSGPTAARGTGAISVVQAAAAPVLVMSNAAPPAVAAVSAVGLSTIESRLEPAPPVQDWQPRDQAPVGGSIVITGSGFRPADVAVRIGTRKLTLVEATPTRVVARAPSGTDPGLLDPHITGPLTVGHAGGQLRTLTESYRVVDRWDGYAPAAINVTRARPLARAGVAPQRQWVTKFDIALKGLPGDEVVGIAGTPADGSCGQQLYTSAQHIPVTDGRVTLSASMNFRLSALSCSRLQLPLRLRYRDQPDDVHTIVINLGPVVLRTIIRVEKTQQLVDAGVITFTGYAPSGTCSGQVDGTPVGRLAIDGDVAFQVHDELGGPACLWKLDQSHEDKWILRDNGWTIHQFGWTEAVSSTGQRCYVQLQPRTGSDVSGFYFERGLVFMGRGTRVMAPDSVMNVKLGCTSTAQQLVVIGIDPNAPHTLTAQLDWVELAAPVGATRWQEVQQ
jgi:hypothetical protein